jgi:hypothetical protein
MKQLLTRLWQRWTVYGHYIGDFQSRLLLTLFYFTILVPFGLLARVFSDPLELDSFRKETARWNHRPSQESDLQASQRQF